MLLLLRLNDLVLASPKLQEPLISFTLFTKGTAKRHEIGVNRSCSEKILGTGHRHTHLLKVLFRLWVLNLLSQFVGHIKRFLLRLHQQLSVFRKRFANRLRFFPSNHVPSAGNDLLLKFSQLLCFLLIFTLLLLLLFLLSLLFLGHTLAFSEDLFERAYLCKKHVTVNASNLSITVYVLRPKIVTKQLIRFGLQ